MKAKIKTLGCRANQYDSFMMSRQLQSYGFDIVGSSDEADLIIINSCTVTNLAEKKSCREARKEIRAKDGRKIIIAAGCSTRTQDKKISNIKGIDFVIEDYDLGKVLKEISINKKPAEGLKKEKVRIRSYVKIEDGCEDNCSYCIVPKVRGKVKSRPLDEIIKETEDLLEHGAKEIVLTGINLGCYKYGEYFLEDVIKKLCEIKELRRLRLSSIEPQYINEELLKTISTEEKVCPYFHIPIQSSSNKILKSMNRRYCAEDIKKIIRQIREMKEDAFISADVIVGFPGENDEDFNKTVDLVKELNLQKLHIFRYSKRPGTLAASFENQVQENEKKKRAKLLNDISKELFNSYAKNYLGTSAEILIEEQKGGYFWGITHNYLRVRIKDNEENHLGDFVKVNLTHLGSNHFDSVKN